MSGLYAGKKGIQMSSPKMKIPYNHGDTNLRIGASPTAIEEEVRGATAGHAPETIVMLRVTGVEHTVLYPSYGINYGKQAGGSNGYLPGQPIRTTWCKSHLRNISNLLWIKQPGPTGGVIYKHSNSAEGGGHATGDGAWPARDLYMAPSPVNRGVILSETPFEWHQMAVTPTSNSSASESKETMPGNVAVIRAEVASVSACLADAAEQIARIKSKLESLDAKLAEIA